MSKAEDRTKEQFIEELEALHRRVAELEESEDKCERVGGGLRTDCQALLDLQHNLRERVKELTCLHGVAQLMTKPGINVEEAFNGVIYLIKNAWQYPEITCARIIFSGKEFKMDNFRLTEWKQSSDIKSNGKTIGTLEVYYLEEKPETYEGPFLGEERALIEGIAQELGNFAERKEMEEELRNSGEKYRAIFHEARDGIALFDGNKGYIVDCNPEFEKQTGRRLKQLKKMRIWDIRPSEMREAGKEAFYTGRSKGKGCCPELEFQKPNGEIVHLECVGKRIKVRSRDYIQCITRDVTERKRVEQELREYQSGLEMLVKKRTAELQEQIGQRITYTRALVHELKTPLTPLVAASDFLVSKIRDEPLLSFAKIINTGALNLSSRIDELLDLARGEVGMLGLRYRPVEFLPLLEDTVNYVTPEVSVNGQSLILDTPACLPIVWSDEERIRQVLLNLLDNAFKFTPKGGRVTLKAREKDAGIIIGVGDNGCGIDEEEKKHLFEPYRRLESNGAHLSGLGLGLSLSKMLIELHGGHISVTSQKGKGSTFSFWLPLKPTGQEKRKTEKEKGHEGSYY